MPIFGSMTPGSRERHCRLEGNPKRRIMYRPRQWKRHSARSGSDQESSLETRAHDHNRGFYFLDRKRSKSANLADVSISASPSEQLAHPKFPGNDPLTRSLASRLIDSQSSQQHYWCFISYRHADNKIQDREWAVGLQDEIERYEVPAELVGTRNLRGDKIPDTIYPVFRDEESLPADADLANSIVNALDRSLFLVALCSPRAVESQYVADEILHFKAAGKDDRVIAVILDGERETPSWNVFPNPFAIPSLQTRNWFEAKMSSPLRRTFDSRTEAKGLPRSKPIGSFFRRRAD